MSGEQVDQSGFAENLAAGLAQGLVCAAVIVLALWLFAPAAWRGVAACVMGTAQ